MYTTQERLAGYRDSLAAQGVDYDARLIGVARSTVRHAIEATVALCGGAGRPTAMITMDSVMTQGALLGLRSLGLRIPEDVSLIGFDDFDLATFTDPPITVIAQPTGEIGPLAAELLLARLVNRALPPRQVCFPMRLISRGSVRALSD